MKRVFLFFLFYISIITATKAQTQICPPVGGPNGVPFQVADLRGDPDSVWTSVAVQRAGACCGDNNCIEIILFLDPGAQGIKLDFDPNFPQAVPQGSLQVDINCVPFTFRNGSTIFPICLSGTGPFHLVYCKPGNNLNRFIITSIPKPSVSPPTVVSDGCTGVVSATGYQENTITWRSVPNNPVNDSYLSATSGTDTVVVSFLPGAPAFVDYEVCGTPLNACVGTIICDTVRVQFVSTLDVDIQPKNATICFGSVGTTLTANGIGGLAPYSYLWNTGATTQSITATTAGTYSVIVDDGTSCPIAFDTVIVTDFPSPILANAGPDRIECNNSNPFAIALNGSVQAATGGIWSSTGTGTFSPNNTTLNASYLPSLAERTAGSVLLTLTTTGNGTCPADTDQVFIRISNAPIVNAGSNQTVCANNPNVSLNGSVSGLTTTGTWSSPTAGTFLPNANTLNATYIPSAADITNGSVVLTLTSTNNGICNPVTSTVTITINPAPIVNAGPNQSVCANNPNVSLSGSVSGIVTTTGIWSSTTGGTFLPNNTILNATYVPSALDITNGTVTLVLSATNFGTCNVVRDTVVIAITPRPIVNAGTDIQRCRNNLGNITLSGSITGGASAGIWTSNGTGSFSPSNTSLNANYIPSAADLTAGAVQLILSTSNHASNGCLIVRDTMNITFSPSPVVNAGSDVTVCANNININLNGSITGGASTGVWTTSGTGTFNPNNSTLNASYIPSLADINAGLPIRIILTSNNNLFATCNPVSDTLFVNITPAPIVNAVANFTVCASNPTINLSATISGGASTGTWTSNGTGTFNNANILNPIYTPSAADISNGTVRFILSSTGNTAGTCNIVRDTVFVTIAPTPVVNTVQTTITRCRNNVGTINVSANFSGAATGVLWTSSGTGTFQNPNANSTIYNPSVADINSNSNILLIATSTGNASGLCSAVSDTILLNFTPAPMISAGSNINVCSNNLSSGIQLNGSVSAGASAGVWTSSGTGTFNNATIPNAIYTPSAADILSGSVNLKFKTTNHSSNGCSADSSIITVTFNPAPIVDAGNNQTICANTLSTSIALNGSVSAGATTGTWTSTGFGSISNPNSLNATYNLTLADRNLSSIKFYLTSTGNSGGSCLAVVDSFTLTILPAPQVNAGPNQTVCANNALVNLSATVTGGATTGSWSAINGTGTFGNANALSTTYNPSNLDKDNGSVLIIFTSTGNSGGLCVPVRDTVLLTINPSPIVNAGADFNVCRNNANINLSGFVLNGPGTLLWTSNGTGTFSSTNTLNTVYTPSLADLALANLTFTLISNVAGCNAVQDQVVITFTNSPIVDITTSNITRCKNNIGTINLNSNISGGATTGVWSSTGTGVFSPNNTSLNPQYIPSSADTAAGNVKLFLTSTGNTNNTCLPVRDSITITFLPAPRAFAGNNRTICANNISSVSLATASIGGSATAGVWSTDGTGSFSPNNTTVNASYNPSPADIAKGFVILTLTTSTPIPLNCNEVSSQFTLTISPAPVVDAGPNRTICSSVNNVALNASVSGGANTGVWTSNGTGTFTPNNNALNAIYTPSTLDRTNGTVKLFFTSTGNSGGSCLAVVDSLTLTILPSAVANAGPIQTICKIKPTVQLNGSVTGSTTTGTWSTTGTGTFIPNANTLNAVYQISPTDTNLSSIIFVLNSTNNGACLGASDTMRVTFSSSDDASFTYTSATYCISDPNAQTPVIPILATGAGGVFSSTPAGLNLNTTTGAITVATSAVGTYNVKFVTNGPCPDSSTTTVHIINNTPNATFTYPNVVCKSGNSLTPTFAPGATPGIFTSNSSNLIFINQNTGEIDLYNSVPGTYTVTNTIPASGTCIGVSDTELIIIERWVVLDLNPTLRTVCENNPNINLQANFTTGSNPLVTSGTWKTNGDGTFSNINGTGTIATYTPGPNDLNTKTVTVRFVSATPSGACDPDSANIVINITPAPVVDAGLNDTICSANVTIPLNGTVNAGASTGIWTRAGGAGTFLPNANTLNAQYVISNQDKLNGSVKLYLTSTGNTNGTCNAVTDSVIYTLILDPVINAGNDTTVCFESDTINLNGIMTGSITTGVWSTNGTGTFIPNTSSFNAKYILSNADRLNGQVLLSLNASAASTVCGFRADTLRITISPELIVDAGNNTTLCANNDTVNLSGTVNGTGNVVRWQSSGDGIFLSPISNLNNRYVPGPNDKNNGSVLLSLMTNNSGNCAQDTDIIQVTITPAPIVTAGTDFSQCANNINIQLNGSVSAGATTGRWTSNGTGQFLPNDSTLNASYIPSNADLSLPSLQFILRSTRNTNGTCLTVRDTVNVNITPSPIVNITQANNVCINNITPIQLNASITQGATKGKWTTIGGDGTFSPHDSILNPTYTPGANDILNGFVNIVISSTDNTNGTCDALSDTVQILISPAPSVQAGIDRNLCVGDSIILNGIRSGSATSSIWQSTGTGTFIPNSNALNATYVPSNADYGLANFQISLTSINTSNCVNVSDTFTVTVIPVPIVNAGPTQRICVDVDSVNLNGSVIGASTTGIWSSNGTGFFSPNATTLNARYVFSAADKLMSSIILELNSTGGPSQCSQSTDTTSITFSPDILINAGLNANVCENNPIINLNGTITGGTTTGFWESTGTGTFVAANTNLINTYTPSAADLLAGSVSFRLIATNLGTCDPDTDIVQFTFIPSPIVDAGANQTICENINQVSLNGIVNAGASTGRWTSTGNGIFLPNDSSLNAIYVLGSNDINNGNVKLYLTSTGNSNNLCNAVRDSLSINISPTVRISMQDTLTVCANNASVNLTPNLSGAVPTGFTWISNGSGTFVPNNTTQNVTYIPSNADTAIGNIVLTFTVGNPNACLNTVDSIRLIITPSPIVNAGANITACINKDTVNLNATVSSGAITGVWNSTGNGQFIPNTNTLNAQYILGSTDKANGFVNIFLTSTGNTNGTCLPISDTLRININPAPIANITNDTIRVCENDADVQLNANITGSASTGIWTSTGTGTFNISNNILNPIYIPSALDIQNGIVKVFFTSTNHNNFNCNPVSDSCTIIITPRPLIVTNDTIHSCITNVSVDVSASITQGALSGNWITLGSGTFNPASNNLSTTYFPSQNDYNNGSVQLVINSTGNTNGLCLAESDTVTIIFTPFIFVDAGDTMTVCKNNFNINLNGIVSGGTTTGRWSTNGTGVFLPNDTTLNAVYVLSNADTLLNNIELTLSSTNNGGCDSSVSRLFINLSPAPFISAGPDIVVCDNSGVATLAGFISGGSTTGIWTSTGTGTFLPNNTTLNAAYIPSTADFTAGNVTIRLSTTDHGLNNCLAEFDELNIELYESAKVNGGPDRYVCYGDTTTTLFANATGANPFRYFWSTGDTTQSIVVKPGTYFVRIQDINDCIPQYDTIDVIGVDTIIQARAGNDSLVCIESDSVQLSGYVMGLNLGHWEGAGTFLPDSSAMNAIYVPTSTEKQNGTFSLILHPSTVSGCTFIPDTVNFSFVQKPNPAVAGPTTVCLVDDTVNYSVVSIPGENYLWQVSGGTIIGANNSNAVNVSWPITGGTLTLIASNATDCDTIIDLNITNVGMNIPQVNGVNSVCNASAFTQNYNVNLNAGNTYSWQITNGTINSGQNTNNVQVTWNGSGQLILLETGALGCVVSDTFNFAYTPLAPSTIQPLNEEGCAPLTLLFDANSVNTGTLTHQWIINNTDTINLKSTERTFENPGVYSVKYILNNGECTDTIETTVTVYDDPLADFDFINAPNGLLYFPNDTLFLQNLSTINDAAYLWDFGDGNTDTNRNPIHEFQRAGVYQIQLRVTDTLTGCISYYSRPFTLEVISNVNSPQVFSPNGDGINDKFRIYERNLRNFKILIFDRWGQIIYTSTDPNFEWDGTHEGRECPIGAYVYHIVAIGEDNSDYRKTDIINLVK